MQIVHIKIPYGKGTDLNKALLLECEENGYPITPTEVIRKSLKSHILLLEINRKTKAGNNESATAKTGK